MATARYSLVILGISTSKKVVTMLNEFSPKALAGSWFAAVAVIAAAALATGVNVPLGATALLLALSLIPPTIILLVARQNPALDPVLVALNTQNDKGRS